MEVRLSNRQASIRDQAAIKPFGTIVLRVPQIGKAASQAPRSRSVQESVQLVPAAESAFNSMHLKTPFRCPSLNFEMRVPFNDDDVNVKRRPEAIQPSNSQLAAQPIQTQEPPPQKPNTPGLYGQAVEKLPRKPENRVALSRLQDSRTNLRSLKKNSDSLPNISSTSRNDKIASRSQSKLSESTASELHVPTPHTRLPDIKKNKEGKTPTVEEENEDENNGADIQNTAHTYKQAGNTSWNKTERAFDLKRLTVHHKKKLMESASSLLDKGFRIWTDKVKDFSGGIVDNSVYEMYARKPVPKCSNIPRVLASMVNVNRELRLKALLHQSASDLKSLHIEESPQDDCEECEDDLWNVT